MKTRLFNSILVPLLLTSAVNAVATPLPQPLCASGVSVADMASGSCSLAGTIFSNFTYKVTGNAEDLAPAAADVHIQFLNGFLNPQLVFSADPAWQLEGPEGGRSNNTYNIFIGFDVAAPGGSLVSGVGLSATGFDMAGSAGKVIETVVLADDTFELQVSGFPTIATTLSDSVVFDGVPQIHVMKKIQLSNGEGQSSGFDSVTQSFTLTSAPAAVPEPVEMLLFGSGLVTISLLRPLRAKLRRSRRKPE